MREKMKLRCPKDSEHDRFSAIAHVAETWEVTRDGDCMDAWGDEVVSGPHFDTSVCMVCGADTIVEEE